MRPVLIFIFAITLASCNLITQNDKELPLTKKALYGNWIIVKLDAKSNNAKYESMMKSATDALKDNIELGIFDFQKKTISYSSTKAKLKKQIAKWALNSDRQLFAQHKHLAASNPEFTITLYRNDSLLLENILNNKKNEELHDQAALQKTESS